MIDLTKPIRRTNQNKKTSMTILHMNAPGERPIITMDDDDGYLTKWTEKELMECKNVENYTPEVWHPVVRSPTHYNQIVAPRFQTKEQALAWQSPNPDVRTVGAALITGECA